MGRKIDLFCIVIFRLYSAVVFMLYMFDKMVPLSKLILLPLC
jgi:hypothetical protein